MSVKSIADLKVKAIAFEQKHRIVPKVIGAATALTVCAVPASAEETVPNNTVSGVDWSSIINTLQGAFTEIINNVVTLATAIIPIGAGVWGLSLIIGYAKSFFKKVT